MQDKEERTYKYIGPKRKIGNIEYGVDYCPSDKPHGEMVPWNIGGKQSFETGQAHKSYEIYKAIGPERKIEDLIDYFKYTGIYTVNPFDVNYENVTVDDLKKYEDEWPGKFKFGTHGYRVDKGSKAEQEYNGPLFSQGDLERYWAEKYHWDELIKQEEENEHCKSSN